MMLNLIIMFLISIILSVCSLIPINGIDLWTFLKLNSPLKYHIAWTDKQRKTVRFMNKLSLLIAVMVGFIISRFKIPVLLPRIILESCAGQKEETTLLILHFLLAYIALTAFILPFYSIVCTLKIGNAIRLKRKFFVLYALLVAVFLLFSIYGAGLIITIFWGFLGPYVVVCFQNKNDILKNI